MKISGCIIQNRQIIHYTENLFNANYKGKRIYISTDHGFGKPLQEELLWMCAEEKEQITEELLLSLHREIEEYSTTSDKIDGILFPLPLEDKIKCWELIEQLIEERIEETKA